jgi:DNA (cytosine-5)-methyltransferase 1
MMRVVELFCGAGGMSLGLINAGMTIQKAYDNSSQALDVHRFNVRKIQRRSGRMRLHELRELAELEEAGENVVRLPSHAVYRDLADLPLVVPEITRLRPDVIAAGPPCQDFSKVNQNREEGPRASLTVGFAIVVALARPKYFIMENVENAQKSDAYANAMFIFREAGYGLTKRVLDSSRYGVATKRERLIVVGCLGEDNNFLDEYLDVAASKRRLTVMDVLGPRFGRKFGQTRGKLYWCGPGGSSSAGTRNVNKPAPTLVTTSLEGPWPNYRRRKGDVLNVHRLPIPTNKQWSAIQGFPPDWNWRGVGLDAFREMVANSVPPPLAEAIGRSIIAHSRGEQPDVVRHVPSYFKKWLSEKYEGKRLESRIALFQEAQRLLGRRAEGPADRTIGLLNRIPTASSLSGQKKARLKEVLRLYDECLRECIELGLPPFDEQPRRPRKSRSRSS